MSEPFSSVPKDRGVRAMLRVCRSTVRRLVGRVIRRRDVDEVLRDAFTRSYAASRSAVRHPRAFILRTATSFSAQPTRTGLRSEGDDSPLADILPQLPAEPQLDSSQRFALFCRAIGGLPEECRRAFVLKKVYGLSQHEIAERLGLPLAAVERQIAAGLLLCRDYMEAVGATALAGVGGHEPRKTSPGHRR